MASRELGGGTGTDQLVWSSSSLGCSYLSAERSSFHEAHVSWFAWLEVKQQQDIT